MKKLLVIFHQWPEPTSSAAGWRMLDLLNAFSEFGYEIHACSSTAKSDFAANLDGLVANQFEVKMNHHSFDEMISELQPDAVLFDRYMVEEQFGWRVHKSCPHALRILDTEDLHFVRYARQEALKTKKPFSQISFGTEQAIREVASIYRCDVSLIISETEMNLLKLHFDLPGPLLHYIPFMHDVSASTEPDLKFNERAHFVSIGNFQHAPNRDAVQVLKKEIWPMIRQRLPEAEMHVYGAYESVQDKKLNDPTNGFIMKGRAHSANDVLSKARVLLAPLRFGAGLKGKFFDSMTCSIPFVTTDIGWEGLENHNIAEGEMDWKAFVDQAVELYTYEDSWRESLEKNKATLKQRFDKQHHLTQLHQRLEQLHSNKEQLRERNFTGRMLTHHTMRSYEYMSRWIEEKNKP